MANSLMDILGDKNFDEPTESVAIKRYVKEQFRGAEVSVKVQEKTITITAKSPALANSLRMHTTKLQRFAATDKKLYFRVG